MSEVAPSRSYLLGGVVAALVVAAGLGYVLVWHPAGRYFGSGAASMVGQAVVAQAGTVPAPPAGSEVTVAGDGTSVDAAAIAHSAPAPAGYVEYKSAKYAFSFYHAPESRIVVYDEGGGASTIALEDFAHMRGFQVFIVPYTEPKISEERFKEDVPSGVRKNVEATTLDGVAAVTFTSEDALLGPTREVWVIKGGYLYEITTFNGVGDWFTPLIQSWHFL